MLVLLRAVEKQMGLVLTLASLAIGWKLMAVQIIGMGAAEPMTQVGIYRFVPPYRSHPRIPITPLTR